MTPKLLIPDGFRAEEYVPPLKADAARWLVSTVVGKTAAQDVDTHGFAVLYSPILRRMMGRDYAQTVGALLAAGVVQRCAYHEGKSMGYRLRDDLLAQRPKWVSVTNPMMRARIERERERYQAEQAARWLPIHDRLNEAQQALSILPDAHDAVERLRRKSQLCQRVHVDRLARGELPMTIASTQRVFNGLSGLQSDLRQYVRLAGAPIGCVDIANSQPAILANLLTNGIPPQGGKGLHNIASTPAVLCSPLSSPCSPVPALPPRLPAASAAAFTVSAVSGVLYDELAETLGRTREYVKKRILVDVLAKRGKYPSAVEDAFRRHYPEVWCAIRRINETSHCHLIRLLQRLESWLVIERVAPKLVERLPIVTLHDAVYGAVHDLGQVADVFRETLEEVGWRLSLKEDG